MDNDILPAKELGMRTVHVLQGIGSHNGCPRENVSDMIIQHLSDLIERL